MSEYPIGATARILHYTHNDAFTERLREFGLIPGTLIRLLRKAPFKGPIEIQYRHSRIVLRPEEIRHMQLERVG